MIRYIILLLILLTYSINFTILLKLKFGKTITLSYISISLIALLSAFLGTLSYILEITITSLSILTCASLFIIYKDKITVQKILSNFLTPGFFIYIALMFYLFWLLKDARFLNIDDFVHWGSLVKDAMRNNSIYSHTQFMVVKPSAYPPLSGLISIYFCKVLGLYKDGYTIIAISSFTISTSLFLLDRFKIQIKYLISIILISFCIFTSQFVIQTNSSMINYSFIFNSSYVDWLIAALFAQTLYNASQFNYTIGDYIYMSCNLFALVMLKQVGLPLAILILAFLLVRFILDYKQKKIPYFIPLILPMFTIRYAWIKLVQQYTNNYNNTSLTSALLIKPTHSYQFKVITDFIKAIFSQDIISSPIKISYFFLVLFVCVFLVVLYYVYKNKNYLILGLTYLLGSIGYAYTICYAMIFAFSEYEAQHLAMFGRYMQTYTYSGILLVTYSLLSNTIKNRTRIAYLFFLLLFVDHQSVQFSEIGNNYNYRYHESLEIEKFLEQGFGNEKIIVINQTDLTYRYLIRHIFAEKSEKMSFFQHIDTSDTDKFNQMLKDNDYLMIGDFDEKFYQDIWLKFTNKPAYNSTIYKIKRKGNAINLEIVAIFE